MKPLKVLVACEVSGVVRDAFRALGHDARSLDIAPPTNRDSTYHIQQEFTSFIEDYVNLVQRGFADKIDLLIAHPPCDHLAVSGARWFPEKRANGSQQVAINFFMECVNAPIHHIAVENPISIMSTQYRKPDQIIQPYWFGHPVTKSTCLWLKNLPQLKPTNMVEPTEGSYIHKMPPSPTRKQDRSRTLEGVAQAMATQWSQHIQNLRGGSNDES